LPSVDLLKTEVLECDLDALERFAKELVLTASVWRIVLRKSGREKPTGDNRPRAIEVVSTLRTPALTAADYFELTCAGIVKIFIIVIINALSSLCYPYRTTASSHDSKCLEYYLTLPGIINTEPYGHDNDALVHSTYVISSL